jgi:hypothetical protein
MSDNHTHSHDCQDPNHSHSHDEEEEGGEEIYIEVDPEEGLVVLQHGDWAIELDPDEARALAQALSEAADEAEASYAEAG